MFRSKRPDSGQLACSFCHKNEDHVAKLISSPSDYPRAYICDECVAVCQSILDDDGGGSQVVIPADFGDTIRAWLRAPDDQAAVDQLRRRAAELFGA